MRKSLRAWSVSLSVLTLLVAGTAFAGENWVGSWKLNAAKSDLGQSLIRAQTLKFEATAAGIALHSEGTDAKGAPMHAGYTSRFDGKDVPWPGNPIADTACPKKIDDNAYENVWKKGGKAVASARVAVSKDGKTLTITTDGTDAQGAKVHSVAVYDRQ